MRAIVIATRNDWREAPPSERPSAVMLHLGDRPFLQHVIETLAGEGITEIDFLLCEGAYEIEAAFDDGARWGCHFDYHLAQDAARPYGRLRGIAGQHDGPILIVHGDRLPKVAWELAEERPRVSLICQSPGPTAEGDDWERWSEWAWVHPSVLDRFPDDAEEGDLPAYLAAAANGDMSIEYSDDVLGARSCAELLEGERRVLEGNWRNLLLGGRMRDGVWLCRNARVHPTATLIAPVYVGENCHIGAGVHLGPNAVAGQDCMIDRDTEVRESLILPGSYVGCDLELANVVVDADRVVSTELDASVPVSDAFVVGSMYGGDLSTVAGRLLSRTVAGIALALFSPVLLLTAVSLALRGQRVFHTTPVVRLPAPGQPERWSTFNLWGFAPLEWRPRRGFSHLLLRLLPGLLNVFRGQMNLVGVPPRTYWEIMDLPEEWRGLYLTAGAGLITEGDVLFDFVPSNEEQHATEAHYAVRGDTKRDLQLVGRYIRHLFRRTGNQAAQLTTFSPRIHVGRERVEPRQQLTETTA